MDIFLLQANTLATDSNLNNSISYFPIGVQFIFALGFVGIVLGATHLLGPKRRTAEKLQNFESGIEAVGNARQPMAIKYFLVAILFVLFVEVLLFVALFLVGFVYIIKKGALTWED